MFGFKEWELFGMWAWLGNLLARFCGHFEV
jgi:hypothetical protein